MQILHKLQCSYAQSAFFAKLQLIRKNNALKSNSEFTCMVNEPKWYPRKVYNNRLSRTISIPVHLAEKLNIVQGQFVWIAELDGVLVVRPASKLPDPNISNTESKEKIFKDENTQDNTEYDIVKRLEIR